MDFSPARDHALTLDSRDALAEYRSRFAHPDADLVYLDGNSLGRLPLKTAARIQQLVTAEWGRDLIRGWNKGWWEAPARIGDKIGQLIGAAPGQTIVSDTVSVNLFKLASAALQLKPGRNKIITDTFNFPSDIYILQGLLKSPSPSQGEGRGEGKNGAGRIALIGSRDDDLTPDLAALDHALDENTALVTFSHVVFKSGYMYDMAEITRRAHAKGALVLWDLSHSVGSVEVALDACDADFAIGCTYKYLNGGPGSQAFMYVNQRLQSEVQSPIWGWWGQKNPFAFDLDYVPAEGMARFLAGTQPMISMLAMETSLEPTLTAGMAAIRKKSIDLTEYAIALFDTQLAPLGFTLGSPRDSKWRGSHISLRHPEAYRINRALIEEMNVIPDFRAPDNIRLGFAPLYTSFADVWEGFERIRTVMEEKRYEKYPKEKLAVT
jgi:kynureninase